MKKIIFLIIAVNPTGLASIKSFEVGVDQFLNLVEKILDGTLPIDPNQSICIMYRYHEEIRLIDDQYQLAVLSFFAHQKRIVKAIQKRRKLSTGILGFLDGNTGNVDPEIIVTEYHICKRILDDKRIEGTVTTEQNIQMESTKQRDTEALSDDFGDLLQLLKETISQHKPYDHILKKMKDDPNVKKYSDMIDSGSTITFGRSSSQK